MDSSAVKVFDIVHNSKTKNPKAAKQRPTVSMNKDGRISTLYPAVHHSTVNRRIRTQTVRKVGYIDRYYYIAECDFQHDLSLYNANEGEYEDMNTKDDKGNGKEGKLMSDVDQEFFVCVGYANVKVKFCKKLIYLLQAP